MGESFPRSTFHGVDASCVFPEDIKPANVEFTICNVAKDIPYEDNFFDYIHQRLLVLGLTDEDWTNVNKFNISRFFLSLNFFYAFFFLFTSYRRFKIYIEF